MDHFARNGTAWHARLLSAIAFCFALTLTAFAQDATSGPRGGQNDWGGMGMGGGGGITGTVTEAAADHYTIKTDAGEAYTVYFSANTRILKQTIRHHGPGAGSESGAGGGNPPQTLKPADIKAGDAVAALGEVDATAKTVGAVVVLQLDPERAKQMRAIEADYGKTWLMGQVTAIDGVKVTLQGFNDNRAHTFQADENTTFRKHREPIPLTDLQVGDRVRVEGAVKDGIFVAATVNVMRMPPGGMPSVPRKDAPATAPQPD
jgi:hypothetical protein